MKRTTKRRQPLKADLLKALAGFTQAVANAGGITVIEGEPGPQKRDLAQAYRRACRVLGQKPIKPFVEDYADQVEHLMAKHERLITLAVKRGYSAKAVAGLVLSAQVAEQFATGKERYKLARA